MVPVSKMNLCPLHLEAGVSEYLFHLHFQCYSKKALEFYEVSLSLFLSLFFETGFLCVALAVLELTL